LQAIRTVYPHAIGCLGDGERDLAPITVATFEGAYRNMERLGNRFDLLIVDEVHHFGTGLRDEALEMAIADARLGLTATPRSDRRRAHGVRIVDGHVSSGLQAIPPPGANGRLARFRAIRDADS
jgi:superfamily II DNA or RNA helicase